LIIVVCLILTIANSVTMDGELVTHEAQEDSMLAVISKKTTPVFAPMGIQEDNWPAVVGIISGILAKEVVVGTLTTLYSHTDTVEDTDGLSHIIQKKFRTPSATFAYLLFILLYFPCISVFAVIKQEIGMRWAIASSLWSTGLAYAVAVLFYQIAGF
jgi:ferrous iron transport protein B